MVIELDLILFLLFQFIKWYLRVEIILVGLYLRLDETVIFTPRSHNNWCHALHLPAITDV